MRRMLSSILALAAGLVTITAVLRFSSDDPARVLKAFFAGPFSSWWQFGNLLNRAGLLVFAATGSALALRSGSFNLGGEAQIYAPALVTAVILAGPEDIALRGILALLAAAGTGALLGFIPGFLRSRFRISELLTSFLLSAALLPVIDYLIAGPLRDGSKNLIATAAIGTAFRIRPLVPPSSFNGSFFIAVALAVAAGLFLSRTTPGFRLRVTGTAPEFARFAGFPTRFIPAAGMTVSGLFHGLAGYFAITGTWYMCHQGISAGMGWSALAVALIARQNPYAVIPAALLYAWLETAAGTALLSTRFSFDSTSLVQAVIFLVISAQTLGIPALRESLGRRAAGKASDSRNSRSGGRTE